ncbi:J domain-containing protein [uncultured Roseobacter sp.]|uniref:J domain-containing protein n=1 Tax=uncultured Roseobacter sp. TaxID=114847 RepID=UPI002605ECDE|nr:J domain-containing protein [uncultured Roseobacter sp.]
MAATPEHAARVLGLTVDATLEEVRLARRSLALKYHPDRCTDMDRASRHMARINAAVDTLVAHIRLQTKAKSKVTRQPDWESVRRAKAAENIARARETARRAKASAAEADAAQTVHRERSKTSVTHPTAFASDADEFPRAELALIRLAAASYRTVLERISGTQPEPKIDVTVLAYPA